MSATIEHIVVLMLENRSFDHIFGFRPAVRGLTGKEQNLLDPSRPPSNANPAFVADGNAPYAVLVGQGPGHFIEATNYQLCNDRAGPRAGVPASNDGFVRNYRDELFHDRIPAPTPPQIHVVMQAFTRDKLPSINALADAFCVCDNWYAEVPGPTQPNRLYMHAGTSLGAGINNWTYSFVIPRFPELEECQRAHQRPGQFTARARRCAVRGQPDRGRV